MYFTEMKRVASSIPGSKKANNDVQIDVIARAAS